MKKLSYLLLFLLILVSCSNVGPTPTAVPDEPPDSAETEPTLATAAEPTEAPDQTEPVETEPVEALDLTQLWSYGLTSIRTGEPLIEEGSEHKLDENVISYGYNLIVDENGNVLTPRGTPLVGGEQLILTEDYQDDENMREYARIYTIMAPLRDHPVSF